MRTLNFSEVHHANGGLVLDQAFFKQNVLYPAAAGAVAGVALGVVLGQSNLGRYAAGYASCFTAYALTTVLLSQTI
jgi:hypothetical protein